MMISPGFDLRRGALRLRCDFLGVARLRATARRFGLERRFPLALLRRLPPKPARICAAESFRLFMALFFLFLAGLAMITSRSVQAIRYPLRGRWNAAGEP